MDAITSKAAVVLPHALVPRFKARRARVRCARRAPRCAGWRRTWGREPVTRTLRAARRALSHVAITAVFVRSPASARPRTARLSAQWRAHRAQMKQMD